MCSRAFRGRHWVCEDLVQRCFFDPYDHICRCKGGVYLRSSLPSIHPMSSQTLSTIKTERQKKAHLNKLLILPHAPLTRLNDNLNAFLTHKPLDRVRRKGTAALPYTLRVLSAYAYDGPSTAVVAVRMVRRSRGREVPLGRNGRRDYRLRNLGDATRRSMTMQTARHSQPLARRKHRQTQIVSSSVEMGREARKAGEAESRESGSVVSPHHIISPLDN